MPDAQIWIPCKSVDNETRIAIKIPFSYSNREWLRGVCADGQSTAQVQDERRNGLFVWMVAKKHLIKIVEALVDRFGEVEVTHR